MSTLYESVVQHRKTGLNALYFGGRYISYKELTDNIDRMVTFLQKNGAGQGDVITLALPNIPAALYAFYAINAIGCVANILHPLTTTENVVKAMKAVGSRFAFLLLTECRPHRQLLIDSGFHFFSVNPLRDSSPLLSQALSAKYRSPKSSAILSAEHFRRCRPARKITPHSETADSVYLHSGGTTGTPKTIVLSDHAINQLAQKIATVPESGIAGKTMLAVLPIFHGFGLAVSIHTPLSLGATCLLMMKFDAKKVLRLVDEGKINVISGIPLLFRKLMECPSFLKTDFRNLELCFVGGDSVPTGLLRDFNNAMIARNSTCRLLEGYGLTETVSVCAVNTKSQCRPGSVGKPLPGISIEIRNDSKQPLPAGATGEIFVAGSTAMNGYLGEEAIDRTVFLPTGDLGFLDEDGFLWIKGRKKRMFKISGVNVYPGEIEQLACSLPGILSASLEFFPHPTPHTVLYLIKTPTADENTLRAQLDSLLKKNCLSYHLPRSVCFLERFPLTAMGKIDHGGFRDPH